MLDEVGHCLRLSCYVHLHLERTRIPPFPLLMQPVSAFQPFHEGEGGSLSLSISINPPLSWRSGTGEYFTPTAHREGWADSIYNGWREKAKLLSSSVNNVLLGIPFFYPLLYGRSGHSLFMELTWCHQALGMPGEQENRRTSPMPICSSVSYSAIHRNYSQLSGCSRDKAGNNVWFHNQGHILFQVAARKHMELLLNRWLRWVNICTVYTKPFYVKVTSSF